MPANLRSHLKRWTSPITEASGETQSGLRRPTKIRPSCDALRGGSDCAEADHYLGSQPRCQSCRNLHTQCPDSTRFMVIDTEKCAPPTARAADALPRSGSRPPTKEVLSETPRTSGSPTMQT